MRKEKTQKEIGLAITALLHESGAFSDRVWMLQLAQRNLKKVAA